MSLSLTPAPASDSSFTFQDDDEETWKIVTSSDGAVDLGQRLTSLAGRFEEDHPANEFWDEMLGKVRMKNFHYTSDKMQKLSTSGDDSSSKGLVAFESEAGKRHLDAISALLGGVSQNRAIQVTLNAFRSIDSDGSQFQSLLGSRDLLWKTLRHHQQQRVARLGVLTECLRLEQDPDALGHSEVQTFLDSLDSLYKDEDRYRGLFRRLLTIACGPTLAPSRERLEPTKALRMDHSVLNPGSSTEHQKWSAFRDSMVEELRVQQVRERHEAMEALLVLLYDRINGGVRRADYAILLCSFQSSHEFFTKSTGPSDETQRLSQLTGLICAECTALWRTLESSPDSVWATGHPLLLEISVSGHPQLAKQEIETLRQMLLELVQNVLQRKAGEAPEALGMLSFGLLLRLAHESFEASSSGMDAQSVTSTFATFGLEMVQMANDPCNAFDYLYAVLDNLTRTASSKRSSAAHDRLYDWQFSDKSHILLLEDGNTTGTGDAPDTTAYTSIAKEVLAASIAAFGDSLLAIDGSDSCQNIGMLCNVGSKVFQNNPLLCQQFWSEWEEYSTGSSTATAFPLCKLLDASHRLTVAALQAYGQSQVDTRFFVQAVAPFFQLLSNLSHTSEMVEMTVRTMPVGLLRHALLCCRLPSTNSLSMDSDYHKSRVVLLNAVALLAQFGNSNSCLEQLRRSLEDLTRNDGVVEGPRILSRIINAYEQIDDTMEPVLSIMAHLLDGAPQEWAMNLAREIMESQDGQKISLAQCLSPNRPTVHSASLVLAELVEHLTTVVFSENMNDHDAVTFLNCVTSSLMAASASLAVSLSTLTMTEAYNSFFSFKTAQTILQALSNFLKLIRTVIELHRSSRVRESGIQQRDYVINTLASSTDLGQAIIYYATAPVSFTLAIKLQGAMDDQSILQQVAHGGDYDVDEAKRYGNWHSYLYQQPQNSVRHLAEHFLLESSDKLTSDDIDLDGIMSRDWTRVPETNAPFDTAFAAIRLLSQWASHIEDILSTHIDDLQKEPRPLKPEACDFIESKSPYRLLSSAASPPLACRRSSTMSSIWEAAGMSNFQLLLPYLTGPTKNRPALYDSIPSSTLLDLVYACLGHVWSISQKESIADSSLFRTLYRSSRFALLLSDLIDRALEINNKDTDPDKTEESQLLDGILSLRVLASCVGSNANVADFILHPGGNSIIPRLVTAALKVKMMPLSSAGLMFGSEKDVTDLRFAHESLGVLSVLWHTVRSLPPATTDSEGSKLITALDDHSNFIIELVTIVSSYALSRDLENRIAESCHAEYARITLAIYMALALQVLATETTHHASSHETANGALEDFLLKDFIQSSRFLGFEGHQKAAAISSQFRELGFTEMTQPMKFLQCFPATSITRLAPDHFSGGNAYDVSSAACWLSQANDIEGSQVDELVTRLSVSLRLVNADLLIMEAWKRFSESGSLYAARLNKATQSTERTFGFVQDTSQALLLNLETINTIQVENDVFMPLECQRMCLCLVDLLLYFLDVGAQCMAPGRTLSIDDILAILAKIAEIGTLVIDVSLPSGINIKLAAEQACVSMAKTIISSAIVVISLIDSHGANLNGDQMSRLHEISKILCRVNSKTLQNGCNLSLNDSLHGDDCGCDLHNTFLCCISLFTSLFSKRDCGRFDTGIYFKTIAATLSEYNVAEQILGQALRCSNGAAKSISEEGTGLAPGAAVHLSVLQSVLDLVTSVAEAGSAELLAIFPKPLLAKILVRNPLFSLPRANGDKGTPRGYALPKSHERTSGGGEYNPLLSIWNSSMDILTAAMHISCTHGSGLQFIDMSMEFLQVYYDDLVFALRSCGSRLSESCLQEVASILGMIAEMCKRHTRDYFLGTQRSLCYDLMKWASHVVTTLSKFVGAAGTARELFYCIEKLHSESENIEIGAATKIELWHPLIDDGIASAKHEAVKFSHYASRCYQRVTAHDFLASSKTPTRFTALAKTNESDSDLERASRVAITNEFTVAMEKRAAACLGQAVSVLWRMHPSSFSFRRITAAETANMDVMSLVQIGTIIGFHPFDGSGALLKPGDGFDALNFGRISSVDSVHRAWIVQPLERGDVDVRSENDEPSCIVRAGQLAGFEDLAFRKSTTKYLPAPNPMSELESSGKELSVGHLILILRWCHQEYLLYADSSSTNEYVRMLAEQVTALLGAELSIHEQIGSGLGLASNSEGKLDAQIFELFADGSQDLVDVSTTTFPMRNGRLKKVISKSAWDAIRSQVVDGVRRHSLKVKEQARRQSEKRTHSDNIWYSGFSRGGLSQKSAFRGFR